MEWLFQCQPVEMTLQDATYEFRALLVQEVLDVSMLHVIYSFVAVFDTTYDTGKPSFFCPNEQFMMSLSPATGSGLASAYHPAAYAPMFLPG